MHNKKSYATAVARIGRELGRLARRAAWDRFRTVWHPEGRMNATWFQGSFKDSSASARRVCGCAHPAFPRSASGRREGRARSRDQYDDAQRSAVDGVICDVVCTGRFMISMSAATDAGAWCYASLSTRRTGSIRSIRRQCRNWIRNCWRAFRKATRHLAAIQTLVGYKVKPDMPGIDGPEVEALSMPRVPVWLAGKPIAPKLLGL